MGWSPCVKGCLRVRVDRLLPAVRGWSPQTAPRRTTSHDSDQAEARRVQAPGDSLTDWNVANPFPCPPVY